MEVSNIVNNEPRKNSIGYLLTVKILEYLSNSNIESRKCVHFDKMEPFFAFNVINKCQ